MLLYRGSKVHEENERFPKYLGGLLVTTPKATTACQAVIPRELGTIEIRTVGEEQIQILCTLVEADVAKGGYRGRHESCEKR